MYVCMYVRLVQKPSFWSLLSCGCAKNDTDFPIENAVPVVSSENRFFLLLFGVDLWFRERTANIDRFFCPSSMVLTQTSHFAIHTFTLLDQVVISHKYQLVSLWLPWWNTSWKTTAKRIISSQNIMTLLELNYWDNNVFYSPAGETTELAKSFFRSFRKYAEN